MVIYHGTMTKKTTKNQKQIQGPDGSGNSDIQIRATFTPDFMNLWNRVD